MAHRLQHEVRQWWEANPMAYDWRGSNPHREGTREWFEELDRRFFDSAAFFAHGRHETPFHRLIPYDQLRGRSVLEIGCGTGAHARLLAEHGATLTAMDLTSRAVRLTRQRLRLWGCRANVLQMDAEAMAFADASFDFVWSWGVIHHSASVESIVGEIARVVRPGGEVRLMVYHRHSVACCACLARGLLNGRLFRTGADEVLNLYSDGRVARYFRGRDLEALLRPYFASVTTRAFGQKNELVPLPGNRFVAPLKRSLVRAIPDAWAAGLLDRVGVFLFASARDRNR